MRAIGGDFSVGLGSLSRKGIDCISSTLLLCYVQIDHPRFHRDHVSIVLSTTVPCILGLSGSQIVGPVARHSLLTTEALEARAER